MLCVGGFLIFQGRIPEETRSKSLILTTYLPRFKLPLTNKITVLFVCCGVFAFAEQISTFASLLNDSDKFCMGIAKWNVFAKLACYVCMIAMMLIRNSAARPPETKLSLLEKALNFSIGIFVIIAIAIPFFYEGIFLPDPQNSSQRTCIMVVQNYVVNIIFLISDVFVSVSLLILFHRRVKTLADPSLGVLNRERYLKIAKINLRCSLGILSSTLIINITITISRRLYVIAQANAISYYVIISVCMFIGTFCVMSIMSPSFEWPAFWSSLQSRSTSDGGREVAQNNPTSPTSSKVSKA
jgi:hypothetical protein